MKTTPRIEPIATLITSSSVTFKLGPEAGEIGNSLLADQQALSLCSNIPVETVEVILVDTNKILQQCIRYVFIIITDLLEISSINVKK